MTGEETAAELRARLGPLAEAAADKPPFPTDEMLEADAILDAGGGLP